MGSTTSKSVPAGGGAAASSSSSAGPAGFRRTRSMGGRVFQSSCLGRSFGSRDNDDNDDDQGSNSRCKDDWSTNRVSTCPDRNGTESDRVKQEGQEGRRKVKLQQEPNWGQDNTVADSGGVSQTRSSRSLTSSAGGRSHSRFSFVPGNISFRLSRAASLGSSRGYSLFSSNADDRSNVDRERECGTSSLSREHDEEIRASAGLRLCPADSGASVSLQSDEIVSSRDGARTTENAEILADGNGRIPRNHTEVECSETRQAVRRVGAREPVERSVRFSRTLSVGRLRDRVLRRSSLSEGLFGRSNEDREVGDTSLGNVRQVRDGMTGAPASDAIAEISSASSNYPLSDISDSVFDSQEYGLEASRPREARYHDILEHRTDFLERRRRIRSQVRALQRLGSRFENLSGHERSCILSGQHRTGRCSCGTSNRTRNADDDTSARASISRIVMLAEALFEVLDEIHQQSVVLSSRPSVSSLGSVPAPKEVVESMPVKIYTEVEKLQSEDIAQCYICLLEYEEGDCMRILPCHHEFHRACIDKWLKEIHRVCPLCRGDVCRSESLPSEN